MAQTYSVKIKGFKTKEEAEEFLNWYEGQGEQDAVYWLEARKDEGKDIRTFLPLDTSIPHKWKQSMLIAHLDK